MGANSKIEWTHHTFNPWIGCTKVAAGCEHCYAEALAKRTRIAKWGPYGSRVLTSENYWRQPLKWNREAAAAGERRRVFCASLADVMEDWPGSISVRGVEPLAMSLDEVRGWLFALIDATPHLDWLLLTKRPENILRMWPDKHEERPVFPGAPGELGKPLPCVVRFACRHNVWLGTSIAEQGDANRNIPELLACRDLAPVLFLSCEPLLGPVEVGRSLREHWRCDSCTHEGHFARGGDGVLQPCTCGGIPRRVRRGIDWVIAGGESGPGARPMHPDWARSLRDQCLAAAVPFFFKQWGEWAVSDSCEALPGRPSCTGGRFKDGTCMQRLGKNDAGRELDGRTWDELPGGGRVQQGAK